MSLDSVEMDDDRVSVIIEFGRCGLNEPVDVVNQPCVTSSGDSGGVSEGTGGERNTRGGGMGSGGGDGYDDKVSASRIERISE